MTDHPSLAARAIPVIPLATAPGAREAWNRPRWVMYAWAIAERLFVTNSWQISSRSSVAVLRQFGAEIGEGATFRPRTRVHFPSKRYIDVNSWIGEGVWFHNQDHLYVGHCVVTSQETTLRTGCHAHRRDMALASQPIRVDDGAWSTSRCLVLGGVTVGKSALAKAMSRDDSDVPTNALWDHRCVTSGRIP